jgi:hypothetical protein
MRTTPIVGGNGNTLKLKTTAKLNNKNTSIATVRDPYMPPSRPSLFLTAGYLLVKKLKGTSLIRIFRVPTNWEPLHFMKPSGFDTGRRNFKIYCKVDTES